MVLPAVLYDQEAVPGVAVEELALLGHQGPSTLGQVAVTLESAHTAVFISFKDSWIQRDA